MELSIIGSGSSGNGYIMQNENEALIIECGIPLKKVLKELSYDTKKVAGCVVSHSHGDHAKYIEDYGRIFDIYATAGTFEEKHISVDNYHYHKIILLQEFCVGEFIVKAFQTEHDTKESCGFIIYHPTCGFILFATDTHHIRYNINIPIDYIMIECNHSDELINRNIQKHTIPRVVGERARATHMSIARCEEFLSCCNLQQTKGIILIHLSSDNSDPYAFESNIAKLTGIPVYIAKEGLEIHLL